MHLTVGLNGPRWYDLADAMLRAAAEADIRLRRSLPTEVVHGRSAGALAQARTILSTLPHLDEEAVLAPLRRRVTRSMTLPPGEQFSAIEHLDRIALDTPVARRRGMYCQVEKTDSKAVMHFHTEQLRAPLSLLPAFQVIADRPMLRARDLPDSLTNQSKLILIRRLVREGFFTPVFSPVHLLPEPED